MLYGKHSNQLFYQESVQSDTFRSKGPYGFVFIDSHELNYRADLEGLEKLDLLVDGAIIVLSGVKESQTYDGHVQYFTDDHPQFTLVNDRNAPATIYKYSTSGRATPTPRPTPRMTLSPTFAPTLAPTFAPTRQPTPEPTPDPTPAPTEEEKVEDL
jgi:hypothetical protein